MQVAIIHVQYYIIITRLPVAYPDTITKLSGIFSAATGAESAIAFSYSCMFPGQASTGQARAQLLGALLVPCITVLASLAIWALRYMFANTARWRRSLNLRRPDLKNMSAGLEQMFISLAVSEPTAGGGRSPSNAAAPRQQQQSPLWDAGPSAVLSSSLASRLANKLLLAARALFHLVGSSRLAGTLTRMDEAMGVRQQLGMVFIIAVFILYPGWAQAALSVFACYMVDDGSGPFPEKQKAAWRHGYWIRDMAQECYSGVHLRLYVPIGIVAVVLVCFGPPLASFGLLWSHRSKLRSSPDVRRRYGFLYARYKPRYFWWESVLMLQELLLVAVEVFGRSLPEVSQQILLMLAAFIAISVVSMTCSPVRNPVILTLEFLSMGVLSLTVTLSLYFVVSDLTDGPAVSTRPG
ncbi:hypothetical protein GPECTOR_48g455 [Gonium pectorale]|uniref:TRP C-terminal domain-containing protein n=1 Tax=Gonium pectorale TaxID=33097 RepID=A0A150G851_GONPE|nr:hypothetical protein GPECTOR_48g455 [Gonium pectorale]|eukprot:KXZ46022.1 hypothetical protein GPECTOR_48g455 [Gonium pectorale]